LSDDNVPRDEGLEDALLDDDLREARGPLPPLREVAEIRKPSTIGGVIYLGVLVAALAGIAVAAAGAWRTGVSWLAVALITAAVTRLLLSDDNAGMLRVRRKPLDAVILAGAGVLLLFLAASIPNPLR
jgi:multisubunit Na+/H+ antiporter MnhB subunit